MTTLSRKLALLALEKAPGGAKAKAFLIGLPCAIDPNTSVALLKLNDDQWDVMVKVCALGGIGEPSFGPGCTGAWTPDTLEEIKASSADWICDHTIVTNSEIDGYATVVYAGVQASPDSGKETLIVIDFSAKRFAIHHAALNEEANETKRLEG